MRVSYLYVWLLLISPILSFVFNGWWEGLLVLASSIMAVKLTRGTPPSTRRMICLTVLINQLVIIHSIHYYYTQAPPPVSGVSAVSDAHVNSAAQPFVSVVLFQTQNSTEEELSQTLQSVQASTSAVLAREIVVPASIAADAKSLIPLVHTLSDTTDFIVYVAPSAVVNTDWLNGFVREFLANDSRLVIPIATSQAGTQVTSAMMSSVSGKLVNMPYIEGNKRVPIIPVISALGVSRKVLSDIPTLPRLLAENRLVELSLRAWFCFEGVIFTRFTTVRVNHPPNLNWRELEGDMVDESITGCRRNIDWFYGAFGDDDPEAKREDFSIKAGNGTNCVSVNNAQSLTVAPCDPTDKHQRFASVDNGRSIRSMSLSTHCLDGASAENPGKPLIMYYCARNNRNQFFTFMAGRLMYSSFCVDSEGGKLQLAFCKGVGATVVESQQFRIDSISIHSE